jgi:hypothetical protein
MYDGDRQPAWGRRLSDSHQRNDVVFFQVDKWLGIKDDFDYVE